MDKDYLLRVTKKLGKTFRIFFYLCIYLGSASIVFVGSTEVYKGLKELTEPVVPTEKIAMYDRNGNRVIISTDDIPLKIKEGYKFPIEVWEANSPIKESLSDLADLRISIINPNGKLGNISSNEIHYALAQGYTFPNKIQNNKRIWRIVEDCATNVLLIILGLFLSNICRFIEKYLRIYISWLFELPNQLNSEHS